MIKEFRVEFLHNQEVVDSSSDRREKQRCTQCARERKYRLFSQASCKILSS